MSLNIGALAADSRRRRILVLAVSFGLSFLAMIVLILILNILGTNVDIFLVMDKTFFEPLREPKMVALIFFWTAPLILTGLSVAIAFKAGLFNIGSQGQMMVGGAAAGIFASNIVPKIQALQFMNTPLLMIPTTMLVGVLGGLIWGGIPGVLKAKTGAHEVIVTIMMNQIALSFVRYLVVSQTYSPFVDKSTGDAYGQTSAISKSAEIPLINSSFSTFLDWSIVPTILSAIIIWYLVEKTRYGYRLRAVGENISAAKSSGINTNFAIISSMMISGGLAGLAGALQVQGNYHKYIFNSEGTLGFDGIAVALVAGNSALWIILSALLFGYLKQGSLNLESSTDISKFLIFTLQSALIIFIAAPLISSKLVSFTEKISRSRNVENAVNGTRQDLGGGIGGEDTEGGEK